MTTVSSFLFSPQNHILGNGFPIIDLSKEGCNVQENTCWIKVPPELSSCIILWENVVEIMESFSVGPEGYDPVFNWVDTFVVGFPSPYMGQAIHKPGGI